MLENDAPIEETTGVRAWANDRRDPLDLDVGSPVRLRWLAEIDGESLVRICDVARSTVVYECVVRRGEREHAVPPNLLQPSCRYRWHVLSAPTAHGVIGTGPGRVWKNSAPIWLPTPAPVGWQDYDVTVVICRAPRLPNGRKPAAGSRLDVHFRAPDQRNGYVWTVDPDVGELIASRRSEGREILLGSARWTPGGDASTRVEVAARGDQIVTRIDGVIVHRITDATWTEGRAGLGAPGHSRPRVSHFAVVDASGRLLAGGDDRAVVNSGERDAAGVLQVAQSSLGLTPPGGEWAFLRHAFEVPSETPVAWATLFITGSSAEPARQFVYRASLNGFELGTGPVRSIGAEARYDGFDATAHLRPGGNVVGVHAWTTADQRVQAELVIGFTDGSVDVVGTSSSWRALDGFRALTTLGSIGTGHYAAPREHLVGSAYPWGFDVDEKVGADWPAALERPAFAALEPNPAEKVTVTRTAPRVVRRTAADTVLLDFGFTQVGGLEVMSMPMAVDITIRYGEMLTSDGRVRHRMSTGNHFADRWESAPASAAVSTWGLRVFRYVEIEGLPEEFPLEVFHARGHVYPLGERTMLETDDAVLADILALCETTMEQNNGNLLVDSWSREREPYEADAYLQSRSNGALSADHQLASYSLDYLLERRTWPTEWPFYLVMYAWELYLRSGDADGLRRRREALCALLPEALLDATTGLVTKDHGNDGSFGRLDDDIVDWPESERDGYRFGPVNTVVNALACGAFSAMSRIDAALGLPSADRHARTAARMKEAINRLLWNDRTGAYRDGIDASGLPVDHCAAHATAFSAAMGVVPQDRAERAGRYLAERGMAVSVYAAPFLLSGLIRLGRAEAAYGLLVGDGLRSWNEMLRVGSGATMEAWSESLKPNVSCAHPWAASPLFLVVEAFAGIRPLEPGYRTFEVAPSLPNRIGRLSVSLPTSSGRISLELRRNDRGISAEIEVPPATSARLRLGGDECELGPGRHHRQITVAIAPRTRSPRSDATA
ncbi:family 78 glycoside hydrolase catalytic domain [Microbacterium sp. SSW1-59]|uniref:family 78 glycoside hydrolase catalytic domain n=1 Tax=Microbacterium xanthum TaxID=3079794 RepID=UPI002AD4E5E4|nr:family 78 glycoside hydrolase catalytic domain [Microbacterium sp. SSW1-59]MDZ8201675.1 family 78 glycoside hydrolase catalytic domain [Microbacterium sp. SSW1-59]